jgi:hypothetical protein
MDTSADGKAAISREADQLARELWNWMATRDASSGAILIAMARCLGQMSVAVSSPGSSRQLLGVLCAHAEMSRGVKIASDSLDAAGLGALNPGRG